MDDRLYKKSWQVLDGDFLREIQDDPIIAFARALPTVPN